MVAAIGADLPGLGAGNEFAPDRMLRVGVVRAGRCDAQGLPLWSDRERCIRADRVMGD
jgi:hypothetical protein